MAFWVNITYAAGTFGATVSTLDIFSNYDSYTTAVATGVAKATLVSGYSLSVPDGTTIVRVKGTGTCVGSYQDISVTGAPTPAPAPAAPTPAAPTPAAPTPAAPTPEAPTPAAPTPTSPNYTATNFGYSGVDGDSACSNYETNNFVTKYPDGSVGNGTTIWNNSNGTGVPTDGYYALGFYYYYSTSGVLGSQTACYSPPTPAAPTPAPAPTPAAPTPAVSFEYYDYELCTSGGAYGGAVYTLEVIQGASPGCIFYGGETYSKVSGIPYSGTANYTLFPFGATEVGCGACL